MMNFTSLQSTLRTLDHHFKTEAGKSVNRLLTIRNWLFGFYIVEFQQNGADRAAYGEQLLEQLAKTMKQKSFSYRNLRLYRQFCLSYPQMGSPIAQFMSEDAIWQAQAVRSQLPENKDIGIWQSVIAKFDFGKNKDEFTEGQTVVTQFSPEPEKLLSHLSFTHFTLLLPLDNPLQRAFYEIESTKCGWSVRELKRQIETLLFERTGLTNDKEELLRRVQAKVTPPKPEDVFRSPYIFEFLGLPERLLADESDLEQALIGHLQAFLLEMGNGFCFEARQKRVLFGDDWHFIDLVFYHRILKCHVLVDLKTEAFKPAFVGNMNAYLNYFNHEVKQEDDNPSVGLLLCTGSDVAAVRYALGGMDEKLFVSQYKILLPDEAVLRAFIERERNLLS